jgi:LacI family transcriptional regulator
MALDQLRREGLLEVRHGQRTRILSQSKPSFPRTRLKVVGLLSPLRLQDIRPFVIFWIEELRGHLADAGYALEVHFGQSYYSGQPHRALEHLLQRAPAAAWVLWLSTTAMQHWFATRGIPTVVAGSCFEGVSLPSVDLDHRAICHHAASLFLARGHRVVCFLLEKSGFAGDQQSEEGFQKPFRQLPFATTTPIIAHHDGSVPGLRTTLDRVLQRTQPPTAFLVSNSQCVLTTMGILLEKGHRLGRSIALVSRDDDSFLEWVVPSVARYAFDPGLFARKLSHAVVELAKGKVVPPQPVRIIPDFRGGDTFGAAAAK